jgi:hypothetical protein
MQINKEKNLFSQVCGRPLLIIVLHLSSLFPFSFDVWYKQVRNVIVVFVLIFI